MSRTIRFLAIAMVATVFAPVADVDAALTPGALHDYDAGNNPLAASDQWQNNGSLGGMATAFGGPPVLTVGDPTYYSRPNGGAFGNLATATQWVDFSAEIWVRRTGNAGSEHQIFGVSGVGGVPRIQVYTSVFGNADDMDVILRGTGAGSSGVNMTDAVPAALPLDQFVQYVFTWNNTSKDFTIYRDGNNVAFSQNLPTLITSLGADAWVELFKANVNEGDARGFNGDISRFRFYNVALTGQQVQDNFNFGNAVPEPSSLALAVCGLMGVALWRRRK